MPKGQAILAEIDGVVEVLDERDEGRKIRLTYSETYDDEYPLPKNYELLVPEGEEVHAGQEIFRSASRATTKSSARPSAARCILDARNAK